jgi:hypothetical protein
MLERFPLKREQNPPCPLRCASFAQWVGEHRSLANG